MNNQAYTEAFRDGMRAAATLSREQANVHAHRLPVRQGDAFLAGYYAEKRRLRA
jgi:diadenosine tetraphosphate (Ap4A) HIT family hydrolase